MPLFLINGVQTACSATVEAQMRTVHNEGLRINGDQRELTRDCP